MPDINAPTATRPVRIFWLGAHKLLVGTELARLRQLGFEVFNPPYLSHVLDQSAVTNWDRGQPSTLPPDVFETLAAYNFFYNTIEPEIAELLANYFDAVVVTIVARWVAEILRVFPGPVVFRTYGQTSLLSNDLKRAGALPLILERDNFHFSPHARETGEAEEDWLQQRMTVIPYCLSGDVFESRDTWVGTGDDIIISAPNILGNAFHRSHYDFLKEFFYQSHFRYAGVQPLGDMTDPQVVGTLSRHAQLEFFRRAAGYLYTYRDPRVCYLPPIEMMVFGGPVIYLSGSLLARYIGPGGPGEATTVAIARQKCDRLRSHADPAFTQAIQAAQRHVIDRYDPAHVWPEFDQKMRALLPSEPGPRVELRASAHFFPQMSPAWAQLRNYAGDLLTGLAQPGTNMDLADLALAPLLANAAVTSSVHDRLRAGATVLQALREVAPTPDGLTPVGRDLAFKPPAWQVGETLDVIDRTNFLTRLGTLGVGSWVRDPLDGTPARLAPVGTAGFLHYGPYLPLAPGRYELQFRFRAVGGLADNSGVIDVTRSGEEIAVLRISTQEGRPQVLCYMLDVLDGAEQYEFRVASNGRQDIYLHAITLQSVPAGLTKSVIVKNFLSGGGALGVGQWAFDPKFELSARFAPAGRRGYLHWGPYMRLRPGQYHVEFAFRATGPEGKPVGRIDIVATNQRPVAEADIYAEGGRLQKLCLSFAGERGEEYEFRLDSSGAADIYLYAISLGSGVGAPMELA